MNVISGVITSSKSGTMKLVDQMPLSSFNIKLLEARKWEVGLDQSSSCTGIAFMDEQSDFVILLDIKHDRGLDKRIFYRELKAFLHRTLSGITVPCLIYEKPVPSKYRSAGETLRELKGKLEEWVYEIPALETALVDSIYPQSWKSAVVDKKKGTNRFNDKAEVASDLVDRYPLLGDFYRSYRYSDYDSFDALGILVGYKMTHFTDNGIPMIAGTMEKRHVSYVCYKWMKRDEVSRNLVQDVFGQTYFVFSPRFMAFNLKYNLWKNIRMASSNNKAVYTILPDEELEQFRWKYGLNVDDPTMCMIMFVFKKGAFTKSEIRLLKCFFDMKEDVYGE